MMHIIKIQDLKLLEKATSAEKFNKYDDDYDLNFIHSNIFI